MPILSTLLELFPLGVLVVNRTSEVLRANDLATEILNANTELVVQKGVIAAAVPNRDRALKAAVESASLNPAAVPIGFSIHRTGRRPLSVTVYPVRKRILCPAPLTGPYRALILLSDPEVHCSTSVDLIATIFELTPAEAVIANRMLAGEDASEIGDHLGISPNTVRNHLKRLFSKTNTTKFCDLLYTLMRSPAGLRFLRR
jgi:DNA-binding CsgD family transcriptional regulator